MTQALPPVRACIFDVDGTLINSEDIYTTIYNHILREYGRPEYPWPIKATQQSRGSRVRVPPQSKAIFSSSGLYVGHQSSSRLGAGTTFPSGVGIKRESTYTFVQEQRDACWRR